MSRPKSIFPEPTFNSKHYKAIGKIIRYLNLNDDEKFIVYLNFCESLRKDNPLFKSSKFAHYCFSSVEKPQSNKRGGENNG